MPRLKHEALVHLVRNAPEMVLELLRTVLAVDIPLRPHPRLTAGEWTNLDLPEFRADNIFLLGDPVEQVFIIEGQGAIKRDKRRTWPLYAAWAHYRWECPILLVVIAPGRKVAAWARRPIDLGHGSFVLHPRVLGADEIPFLTDPEAARRSPELAVLSVMAHGDEPGAERIALAALNAARALDTPRSLLYADFTHALLGKVARVALEALMDISKYEYQSDFARRYFGAGKAEGRTEGKAEGKAEVVLSLLAHKGLRPDDATRVRVMACQDIDQLDRWARRVLSATTLADVFSADDAG